MKTSSELEQELKQYKQFAKKKLGRLTASWLRAIQYEEEHPSPEVRSQEAMMSARVNKFSNHKWEPGEICYKARHSFVEGALIVGKFTIKAVADNKLVTATKGLSFDPADVVCDDLAAIAVFYFKTKDMAIPDDKLFYTGGKLTRYQFRRLVREWYFEVLHDTENKK